MNLHGKIDTHFAFAILILVAALLAFSFWFIYESDKDNASYGAMIKNAAHVDMQDKQPSVAAGDFQTNDPVLSEVVVEDISANVDVNLDDVDDLSNAGDVSFDDLDF